MPRPKHYKQFWGSKMINKAYLKRLIEFDFKKLMEKTQDGHKMLGQNKRLMSPTRILKPIMEHKFFGIPQEKLEQRRQDGSSLMENLETIFRTKDPDLNKLAITAKQKKDLFNLLNFFQQKNIKLLTVEKPVTNGIIYGIVDCIVKMGHEYFVMEIKLRNNLTIENTDRFQAKCYSFMLEIPALIICLSDNGDVKMERLNKADFQKPLTDIKNMYKLFGVELDFKQKLRIE